MYIKFLKFKYILKYIYIEKDEWEGERGEVYQKVSVS